MANIIRLHGDAHDQTQRLLPWYANGTLASDEVALVEAHLTECAQCQSDLRFEQTLGPQIANLPLGEDAAWSTLRDRIEHPDKAARRSGPGAAGAFFRRPVPIGWAIAAQIAGVALGLGLLWSVMQPHPRYVTLGSAASATAGNVIVMFRPTISELDLRRALVGSGARLVDGPTASDAYVLHVAEAKRDSALASLRANRQIVLAEPIDGDLRP